MHFAIEVTIFLRQFLFKEKHVHYVNDYRAGCFPDMAWEMYGENHCRLISIKRHHAISWHEQNMLSTAIKVLE